MDLEENIKKAAEVYYTNHIGEKYDSLNKIFEQSFIIGAKSQAAKDYWYNEFKRQKIQSDSGQDQSLRNQPLKPSECFNGKSSLESNFEDGILEQMKNVPAFDMKEHEPIDKNWIDSIFELQQQQEQYDLYIKENSDRPISFDNWKYMVEHYPDKTSTGDNKTDAFLESGIPFDLKLDEDWHKPFDGELVNEILSEMKDFKHKPRIGIIGHVDHGKTMMVTLGARNKGKSLMASIEQIPFELGGLGQAHHKGVIAIVPDQASMDYASEITRMIAADTSVQKIMVITRDQMQSDKVIKFMDGNLPDKDFILTCHDNAIKATILREKHEMDKPWKVKKQKKENHKRNNKRRK